MSEKLIKIRFPRPCDHCAGEIHGGAQAIRYVVKSVGQVTKTRAGYMHFPITCTAQANFKPFTVLCVARWRKHDDSPLKELPAYGEAYEVVGIIYRNGHVSYLIEGFGVRDSFRATGFQIHTIDTAMISAI